MVTDGHKVEAKVLLVGLEYELKTVDATVNGTSIQIIKCTDSSCCTKFQTNWMQVFPQCFIPFPAVYSYAVGGMKVLDPDTVASNPKVHAFASLTEGPVQKLVHRQVHCITLLFPLISTTVHLFRES